MMMSVKRHIPNFITCLNLFCGCMAVVFALRGWLGFAVYMVIAAALFDFCDGLAARLLKAFSSVGKELDSLADLISFGLAPAAMLHFEFTQILSPKLSYGAGSFPWELLSFFPFVVAVAAAIRLAKFNVDTRQSDHFRGLPTPASALFISSLLVYITRTPKWMPLLETPYSIPIISLLVSFLMVSHLPMISLKMKSFSWNGNQLRFLFLLMVALLVALSFILGWPLSLTLCVILFMYMVVSPIWLLGNS